MNLRKTEAEILGWLVLRGPSWYKWSWGPKARLLKRGLIEEVNVGNAHGMIAITERGRAALRNWKGIY